MAEVQFKGKTFEVDEDGFLLHFEEWCPEWLEYVKESEGIKELTPDHQKILDFLQDYYKKNGIAPMVRILSKNTGYKLKEVYELFPPDLAREPAKWLVFPSLPDVCSLQLFVKKTGETPSFFLPFCSCRLTPES